MLATLAVSGQLSDATCALDAAAASLSASRSNIRPARVMAALPAALAGELPESELLRIKAHRGGMTLWSFTHRRPLLFSGWEGVCRLMAHGLSGHGRVTEPGSGAAVLPDVAKIHLCRCQPCGYRYDNRVEPFQLHGRVMELTPGGSVTLAGEVPGSSALVEAGVLADAAAASDIVVADAATASGGSSVEVRALDGSAAAAVEAGGNAMGLAPWKRRALELCLAEDVVEWCRPYTDIPHLIFVLWSIVHKRPASIVCGSHAFDAVEEFAPWARDRGLYPVEAAQAPTVWAIACQVTVTPGSESRHLQWPATLLGVNHWHAAAEVDGPMELGHAPCHGDVCGDIAEPCLGLLLDDLAARNLVAFPTACDGDCGPDVVLFWEGRPGTPEGRLSIRRWFADAMWERRLDDDFLSLYDIMALPKWEAKAAELAAEAAFGVSSPRLRGAGAAAPEVVDAVAWALRGCRHVGEDELASLSGCLDEEQGRYWVERMTEERQLEASGVTSPAVKRPAGKRGHCRYNLGARLSKVKQYIACVKNMGDSKPPRGFLLKFLEQHGLNTSKASRQQFTRMVQRAKTSPTALAGVSLAGRSRFRGKQGCHLIKGAALRAELAQWFCHIRGRVKGRLPVSVLRLKAQRLREDCLRSALQAKVKVDVPAITSTWLWRWRREYAVSLRQPNRRWKVPRKVLLDRLRIMWRNTIRLRAMALVLLGYDLSADGFDQKPFHMNEAGSKSQKTLAVRGAPEVALKELHDATRERWTANTWTTSRRDTALAGPPLEVMFKGGSRVLAGLEAHIAEAGHNITAATSNSASYRREHVLSFMEKALPATKPGPAAPWRLLFCDAYRAHDGEAVRRLAWNNEAVIVLHGGGTTGVAAVNDTHLHGPLSKAYQDLEMQAFFLELALDPMACPRRSRAQCVDDLAACWRRPNLHLTALAGWKSNLIMVALDGSEDRLGSQELLGYWAELGMDAQRRAIIEDVCQECEAGRLSWTFEVVQAQIEPFELTGFLDYYEEGQEDEGELVEDERAEGHVAWDDGDGPSEPEDEAMALVAAPPLPPVSLSEAQEAEAAHHASRLRALDEAAAAAPSDARLEKVFAAVRRSLLREASGRSQGDAVVAQAVRYQEGLRRDAADQLHAELLRRQAARDAQAKALGECVANVDRKIEALRQQEIALTAAGHREDEARRACERRLALASVATGFTTNELGQGQAGGGAERFRRARQELVAQVALLGDELPLAITARLPQWIRRWDEQGVRQHDRAWASVVRDEMTSVVNRISAGETAYFRSWHSHWTRRWGLDLDDVRLPGRGAPMAP